MASPSPIAVGDHEVVTPCANHLDEESFKTFAPFLRATQQYSECSGYRFRSSAFREDDAGYDACEFDARMRAAPAVHKFKERLEAREPALLEELDRAFRLVMAESVRNSMVSHCQQLGIFPPLPRPAHIDDDDCAYQDASSPLLEIAQRLYNEKIRRDNFLGARLEKRVLTAAYIVDFATEMGASLPEMPETYSTMLQEFTERVSDWEALQGSLEVCEHDLCTGGRLQSLDSDYYERLQDMNRWWGDSMAAIGTSNATSIIGSCVGLGRHDHGVSLSKRVV